MVRNITGAFPGGKTDTGAGSPSGAFYYNPNTGNSGYGGTSGLNIKRIAFSANREVATDSEVRPYSIRALPLISY